MKPWLARAVFYGFMLVGGVAHAAECVIPDATTKVADYEIALNRLKLPDCLGSPTVDNAPVVARFEALTDQPTNLGQSERLVATLEALATVAQARASASGPLQSPWAAMLKELRAVRMRLLTLSQAQSKAEWLATVSEAIEPKWRYVSVGGGGTINMVGQNVNFLQPIGCMNEQPCPDFQSQLDLVRLANLMARLAGYAQGPSLADQYEDSQLALARWEAYRTQALHQYIWEVWANGLLMDKALCPQDAGTGMKMGFCKVPQSQWIILHPEGALRFSNAADKSSSLKAALVVELLGYHGWRWKTEDGKDTAGMEARRGYSLAATYTATDAEKRWAFGPMFHLGDYAFALTKASGGGRWSLVINVPLADRYFGRKQQYVDALRKVRKADLSDLVLNN